MIMTLDGFRTSLASADPPPGFAEGPLAALWWDAKGDWARAHRIVADDGSAAAAHVHAYLHRKEGDGANAAYWYRRAGRPIAGEVLDAEWEAIVAALLAG